MASWRYAGALGNAWRLNRGSLPPAVRAAHVQLLHEVRGWLLPHGPGGSEEGALPHLLSALAGRKEPQQGACPPCAGEAADTAEKPMLVADGGGVPLESFLDGLAPPSAGAACSPGAGAAAGTGPLLPLLEKERANLECGEGFTEMELSADADEIIASMQTDLACCWERHERLVAQLGVVVAAFQEEARAPTTGPGCICGGLERDVLRDLWWR